MESHSSSSPRRAHLIGIAGSGMRALADVLLGLGWRLSGSDLNADAVRGLAEHVRVFHGHDSQHVPADAQEVIYSEAIPQENPERCRARELGIAEFSYAQTLGRLGTGRTTIAIAGTHGKSTTTSMLGHLLCAAGHDPTIVCGATSLGRLSGGRYGESKTLLVEACEFRANFLHLRPQQAAILGVELDHVDCYASLADLESAFRQFVERLPADGYLVARHDCEATRRVGQATACHIETFGLTDAADWWPDRIAAEQGCYHFTVRHRHGSLGEVRLQVPGVHNVLNALAAAAIAHRNGLSAEEITVGLNSYAGLHRRLERLGPWHGVERIDDYAHHPTEIAYAVKTVREMFPHARVWCVFQPHQASRTRHFLEPLAHSLQNVDKLLIAEIFRAREGRPRAGEISAADLAQQAVGLGVDVIPGHTDEEIRNTLAAHLAVGDVLITLGAGDVAKFQPPWEEKTNDEIKMTNVETGKGSSEKNTPQAY